MHAEQSTFSRPFEPSLWKAQPSRSALRIAAAVLIAYVLALAAILPWARHDGPALPAFIGLFTTGVVICDVATAFLLLTQPECRHSRTALLPPLAYLASASLALTHLLTFPGAIRPDAPLVGGAQLGSYTYLAWRGGFGLLILAGIAFHDAPDPARRTLPVWPIVAAVPCSIALLFLLALWAEPVLPRLIEHGHFNRLDLAMSWTVAIIGLAACALLWLRRVRTSVLHLWLAVAVTTFCGDLVLSNFAGARFTVGWYMARLSGVLSATVVLIFFIIRFAEQQRQAILAAHTLGQQAAELQGEIARRTEIESRLAQAQKMETIGQLTGGVAHDFNNLLTPIVGALELVRRRLEQDERALRLIDGGLQAADRARTLIQRLLAFSRRQLLDPRSVRIDDLIEGMADLIRHTAGPRIEVQFEIAQDLPSARVDANQFELALLNLAVNARDAMPAGGALTIAAAAAHVDAQEGLATGDYVRITVVDSGVGMNAETLSRAVDPFFTTKEPGRGTGLGLSMVHGLAAQLGGAFQLASKPGQGTVATLFLPVSAENLPAAQRDPCVAPLPRPHSRPTLLLVDDEELVRSGVAVMLGEIGYDVVETGSAAEALKLIRGGLDCAALITDFAMPGTTGPELARQIHHVRPELPVLVITGYAALADRDAGGLPRLAKPFRQAELAAAIAAILPEKTFAQV